MTAPVSRDFARLGPPAGSTVVVCGGCGGIGTAIVKGCLATGLDTIVLDLPATHDANPPPPEAQFIAMDAFEEEQVKSAFMAIATDYAAVDAVLNLIGAGKGPRALVDTPTEDFDEVVHRNLRASFLISKYAMPLLKASGAGSLVHTATGMAIRTIPGVGPYAAAKAGVIGLTRALAIENGPTVRVNVIAPGGVTNKVKVTGADAKGPGGMDVAAIMNQIALKRFADPDDMVAPFLFLAGPSSIYITGQTLHVNGGAITP